jgi:hypothetical protein
MMGFAVRVTLVYQKLDHAEEGTMTLGRPVAG